MISAAQWKRAIGPHLDPNVDWSFRGKFTYLRPVDWVLMGVLGEGSSSRPD